MAFELQFPECFVLCDLQIGEGSVSLNFCTKVSVVKYEGKVECSQTF